MIGRYTCQRRSGATTNRVVMRPVYLEAVEFLTKPKLATGMLDRALSWVCHRLVEVLADEVYDRDGKFRRLPERRASRLSSPFRVSSGCGLGWSRNGSIRLPAHIPEKAWFCMSTPTGPRAREGGSVTGRPRRVRPADRSGSGTLAAGPTPYPDGRTRLLLRHRTARSNSQALGHSRGTTVGDREILFRFMQTAGLTWLRIRSAFMGWVASTRDLEHAGDGLPHGGASGTPWNLSRFAQKSATLIPLTEPEVRRLLIQIALAASALHRPRSAWSRWRRTHQAHAKACHYRTRALRNAQL